MYIQYVYTVCIYSMYIFTVCIYIYIYISIYIIITYISLQYIHCYSNSLHPRCCVSIIWVEIPVRNGNQQKNGHCLSCTCQPIIQTKPGNKNQQRNHLAVSIVHPTWIKKISGRFHHQKIKLPWMLFFSSWWFQPIWKILLKMRIFPR